MSTLNDLHGKVPPPPVHVVALGFNGPWEVQTMKVRLATCRDRNVADYIAALWNLMPPIEETPKPFTGMVGLIEMRPGEPVKVDGKPMGRRPYRRRKAGKSVQVMP